VTSKQDQYNELAYYTLAHRDAAFIHQHVVDAFAAQNADEHTKPIAITFALVGLYLYLEKGFTGRQVQRMHMLLAKQRKEWPKFTPPQQRGAIAAADVLAALPGRDRDAMIRQWAASVWDAWKQSRDQVAALVKKELDVS